MRSLLCIFLVASLAAAATVTVGSPEIPSSYPWCGS